MMRYTNVYIHVGGYQSASRGRNKVENVLTQSQDNGVQWAGIFRLRWFVCGLLLFCHLPLPDLHLPPTLHESFQCSFIVFF